MSTISDGSGYGNGVDTSDPVCNELNKKSKTIRQMTKLINMPQALAINLKNLNSDAIGGLEGIAKLLHVDLDKGVETHTVDSRREIFGCNSLPTTPRKDFWTLFVDTFDDATLQILIVAAIVSLIIGIYDDPATGYVEGLAILAAVLIVSIVTAANDYQKESQFRELSAANDSVDVVVVRDGLHWQIPVEEIVVGDIVCVEAGDQIPCDGVLVRYDGLEVDESTLTGEPIDVDKDSKIDPFLLSGCTTIAGTAQYISIAVGRHSQWGIIKSRLEKEQEQTPLQEKLDEMAALIGYVGMGAAAATFCAMMFIKLVMKPAYLEDVTVFAHALNAFIIGVTIVVVAVPEGLPLAVTISLAFSTRKMLADQNLIRHLTACETMGNATNICSDKTGTLTQNRMTVVKGVFADTRNDDIQAHKTSKFKIPQKALNIILECIACCSTARIIHPTDSSATTPDGYEDTVDKAEDKKSASGMPAVVDNRPKIIGNKTEAALLLLAQSNWGNHDNIEKRRAEAAFGEEGGSRVFPFSSGRKRMTVLVCKEPEEVLAAREQELSTSTRSRASIFNSSRALVTNKSFEPTWTLYQKGAAEVILQNCTKYLDSSGEEKPLTDDKRATFEKIIRDYASGALRCVALAHRKDIIDATDESGALIDPATITLENCEKYLEKDLCLDAITGIADPLRPEVVGAVETCQNAGIFVRMVTGDNIDTAVAIAKQAGILTKGGRAMTGAEFRELTPAQLDEVLPSLQVLARSSPEDKHLLVQRLNGALMPENEEQWLEVHRNCDWETQRDKLLPGYKEEWAKSRDNGVGEVVGVTGDGTNDGPALKAADVGLSMGLSGTDVAKKASDIIIMDDNFASIVKAVLWGRSVFDNIRKFLQFQLTVNVVALTITFLAAVVGYNPPLNAVMMLWVNLIMDTMGALALGTEPPRPELLDRRPYRRDASLVSLPMWRNIFVQATYQLALMVFLLNAGPDMFGCEDGSTHHFTIIFNAFVFCQVFNEFNAREIGDRFDPLRSMVESPMFLLVIFFTVISQWFIVEFGGDFTQTQPLTWNEWKITIGFGFISIPVGFFMRLIPVSEDPHTFAGIERKGDKKPFRNWLRILVALLLPIISSIIYQLYWEVEELREHESED